MKYAYNGKEIKPVVEIYHDVYPLIAGISEGAFFRDTELCAKAWKIGNEAIKDYFGDLIPTRVPSAAPLSYGHLVSIGAPLRMSEEAEPNIVPFLSDIDEAIAYMKDVKNIDFADNDVCRHYMETNRYLQEQYPEHKILPLQGYSYESVITAAELMRGQDFFMDIYDEPEKTHEFLTLLNESIINFVKFHRRTNGQPEVGSFSGIADDFASVIPPHMWSEFVIPYWDHYFNELTLPGGTRRVHCEDTYPEQLRYLKDAKVSFYQPSVSERLTIENVRANTDIPFDWLLYAWQVLEMSDAELEAWVDSTVQAGISIVRTQFGAYAWKIGKLDRIVSYMKAFEKYRVE